MAVTPGVNSWCSVVYADAYFDTKWDASAWATLSAGQKEQLLITAFNWINQQKFFNISPTATAEILKQAQCETAWFIYEYWGEFKKRRALINSGVTSFSISKFRENLTKMNFPEFIIDMLSDYVVNLGGVFPTIKRDY